MPDDAVYWEHIVDEIVEYLAALVALQRTAPQQQALAACCCYYRSGGASAPPPQPLRAPKRGLRTRTTSFRGALLPSTAEFSSSQASPLLQQRRASDVCVSLFCSHLALASSAGQPTVSRTATQDKPQAQRYVPPAATGPLHAPSLQLRSPRSQNTSCLPRRPSSSHINTFCSSTLLPHTTSFRLTSRSSLCIGSRAISYTTFQ